MNITEIKDLIIITNSFIHRHLSTEESANVEILNERLLHAEMIYNKTRHKIIADYGGKDNGAGEYIGIKDPGTLSKVLVSRETAEVLFEHETRILSKPSYLLQKKAIDINTVQLKLIKKYILIEEPEESGLADKNTVE